MSNLNEDAEPAIWLRRTEEQRWSKLGGLPNLPRWISWPRRKFTTTKLASQISEMDNAPKRGIHLIANAVTPIANFLSRRVRPSMHFIGQIDLSELPQTPLEQNGPSLPNKGFLFFFANVQPNSVDDDYFFYHWMEDETDDGTDTRVIYSRFSGAERQPPKDLPPLASTYYPNRYSADDPVWIGIFPSCHIEAKQILTGGISPVPSSYIAREAPEMAIKKRDWLAAQLGVDIPTVTSSEECRQLPVAMYEHHLEVDGVKQIQSRKVHYVRHQMFGLAPTVQYESGSTRNATDRLGGKAIPLMTFDTDSGVHDEFIFCDAGLLQFWIKPNDLAAQRFDKCYTTTEGG